MKILKPILMLLLIFTNHAILAAGQSTCDKNNASCGIEFISIPKFSNPMECGTTQTGNYIIQSNVPSTITITNDIIPLIGDTSPGSVVQIISGEQCSGIKDGDTCTVEVEIIAAPCALNEQEQTIAFPQNIEQQLVAMPNVNTADLKSDIIIEVVNNVSQSYIVTAAGQGFPSSGPSSLLLAVHDSNDNWQVPSTPENGTFYSTTCANAGSSAVCIAVGQYSTISTGPTPIMYISTNGGVNWGPVSTTPPLPSFGNLTSVSCTETGEVCYAVGTYETTSGGQPLLFWVYSIDSGVTWNTNIPGTNVNAVSDPYVSCTGKDNTFFACSTVLMTEVLSNLTPFLQIINNHGTYLLAAGGPPLPSTLNGTSCVNNGTDIYCTFVGSDGVGNAILRVNSTAANVGAGSWSIPTSITIPSNGFLATDCTILSGKPFCTAVGITNTSTPLLYVTTSSDLSSWAATSSDISAASSLAATACTTSGTTAVCTAAGRDASQNPILFVTNDSTFASGTWINPSILGKVPFTGTACVTDPITSKVICSAAGGLQTATGMLLYINTDVVGFPAAWTAPSISDLPFIGYFNSTGVAGS